MDTAFGWLGKLMETVGSLFPRLVVVKATHGGVAFVRGKLAKEIRPGLMLYWPIWTDFILYPAVRQSLNLPSQTLTTKDGRSITTSAVLVYEVNDMLKALTVQHDLDDTLRDISLAAVREHDQARTFDELRCEDGAELRDTIRRRVQKYGVRVCDAWVTDFAETRVLTLVSPGSTREMFVDDVE